MPRCCRRSSACAPWEVAEIGMGEAEFDAHRADLEAHRPFAGMLVRRRDAQGRARVHSVSGEPRFTADGIFDGYWGVARDVSEEMRAAARLDRQRDALPRAVRALAVAALPAPARHHLRRQSSGGAPVRLQRSGDDVRCAPGRPVRARRSAGTRRPADRAARVDEGRRGPAGRRPQRAHRRRPAHQRPGDRRARRFRGRPGDALDPVRQHRAAGRRDRAAPLRGDALAPVRDQPGLHHAVGAEERPPHDGQRRLRAPHRLQCRRGRRPHRHRARPVAGPARPRSAARGDGGKRPHRRDAGAAADALGRRSPRCWSRPPASRWTGATTWSSTRAT